MIALSAAGGAGHTSRSAHFWGNHPRDPGFESIDEITPEAHEDRIPRNDKTPG
jgi:hypothetical protein